MYNWITLLCSRNDHNIVNQLYFNNILGTEKKKKNRQNYLSQQPLIINALPSWWNAMLTLTEAILLKGTFDTEAVKISKEIGK